MKINKLNTLAVIMLSFSTMLVAGNFEPRAIELNGDNCSIQTEVDAANQVVKLTFKGKEHSGAYADYVIPMNLLPLQEGASVDLTNTKEVPRTVRGLEYHKGYLKLTKQGKTDFMESDKLGIYIDADLQNPQSATLTEGVFSIPVKVTRCRF